jgi:DNA-directed RNA polymerase specialized sigma24 family protein
MNDNSLTMLRHLLLLRYSDFKARLTRRLGSADLAGDALQDTWLRLEDGGNIATVHRPDSYLFRIALNIARDRQRAETRRLTSGEIGELLNIEDDEPNPAQVAEAPAMPQGSGCCRA